MDMDVQERNLIECNNSLIQMVLASAIEVHKYFGPGLMENVYEKAFSIELIKQGCSVKRQVEVPVHYRGQDLGLGFRADIIVEDCLLLELKCVEVFKGIHVSQLITYLKLLNIKSGFLINFNTKILRNGIKKVSI